MKHSPKFLLMRMKCLQILLLLHCLVACMASKIRVIDWTIVESSYTRLCSTKKILTVNGLFPGPIVHAHVGETLLVNVINRSKYNVTLHWHGAKQPRNPWSDGPEYITQCPIMPRANFTYEIVLSDEEGTIWWHAHSDWSRATVHGAFIIYPKHGHSYPFPIPDGDIPIMLGSWYKGDVMENIERALATGGEPNLSDAFTINGQPGALYNCSLRRMFKTAVDCGKTYLLRIINGIMNEEMFFMIANHTFTIVGTDAAYIKPFTTDFVFISPGQTIDVLVKADQPPGHYFMASRPIAASVYSNSTTTALFMYNGNYTPPLNATFPNLPDYNDTDAAFNFTENLKSINNKEYPISVPRDIDKRFYISIAVNARPCTTTTCDGPNGTMLASSLNNISYIETSTDILQSYHRGIGGVYSTNFPKEPPTYYNFTSDDLPTNVLIPERATKVIAVDYNLTVEIVFQGTSLMSSPENHPMHLHGYSFYLVGSGFGNYNNVTDPKGFNLVDPPLVNTIGVPKNGWAAIRFRADNPGVWFMHCHLERHSSWGMSTVLIVKNGKTPATSIRPPPAYLNPC